MADPGLKRGAGGLAPGPSSLSGNQSNRRPMIGHKGMKNADDRHRGNQKQFGIVDLHDSPIAQDDRPEMSPLASR
jgi:hypothetical protein